MFTFLASILTFGKCFRPREGLEKNLPSRLQVTAGIKSIREKVHSYFWTLCHLN